jgi:hypothetical protein
VDRYVQDYIKLSLEKDQAGFCQAVGVPVLIFEVPRTGLLFSQGQTRLTREVKKLPLARDLIREGHQLPTVEVRQRMAGPVDQVRVGRAKENDIILGEDTVSSRHAVFQRDPKTGISTLQDLASMNGTRVNGIRLVVGKAVVLFDGDVLAFGDNVFLFFYPQGLYEVLRSNLDSLGAK